MRTATSLTMAKSITSVSKVVCSAKPLFPKSVLFRKCSNFSSIKAVLSHSRVVAAGAKCLSGVRYLSSSSDLILNSPLGPVDIPDVTLPAYVWRDFEEYSDKPAIVSDIYLFLSAVSICHWLLLWLLDHEISWAWVVCRPTKPVSYMRIIKMVVKINA